MAVFAYAVKLMIAGLFLYAGLSKLRPANQRYYQSVIEGYGFTSSNLQKLLPTLIGAFELVTVIVIIVPTMAFYGLLGAAFLLTVYGLIFTMQMLQGRADINCGCAGPGADVKIGPALIFRNGVLVVLSLFAASSAGASFESWYLVLPISATLGLIYLSAEQLMLNQQKIQLLRNT